MGPVPQLFPSPLHRLSRNNGSATLLGNSEQCISVKTRDATRNNSSTYGTSLVPGFRGSTGRTFLCICQTNCSTEFNPSNQQHSNAEEQIPCSVQLFKRFHINSLLPSFFVLSPINPRLSAMKSLCIDYSSADRSLRTTVSLEQKKWEIFN